MIDTSKYCADYLVSELPQIFGIARRTVSASEFRRHLAQYIQRIVYETYDDYGEVSEGSIIRVRDCARCINRIITRRSEHRSGFSVSRALRDIALRHKKRTDLSPAFFADILHLFLGLQGRGPGRMPADLHLETVPLTGRDAAIERSQQLDELNRVVAERMKHFTSGLEKSAVARRTRRKKQILSKLGATEREWYDWRWQFSHILRDVDPIEELLRLTPGEQEAIRRARENKIPFGITPYYLSLMDNDPSPGRDRSIRAQVIPPPTYIDTLSSIEPANMSCLDFMLESDTSPIDLVTRRYPSICIFKPFNTCPQICVYCQRNWEIDDAMMPDALAPPKKIKAALRWIEKHPTIHEVLVTGGDPLGMSDKNIKVILDGLAAIPSVERIRIGSRTLVTAPMRITDKLCDLLARYRIPGKRQVSFVTHVQHAYEVTPDVLKAAQRLILRGIQVYNQLVYTFFVSRRFEAAFLKRELVKIGINPYYTFNTKGKEETIEYRVPIARLMQEQKEEARLFPGLERTDEAVFNVPGMGKNYLRARQHRDLISILPDGARLYEFHPWEKNISSVRQTYINQDVPILEYLERLDEIGEDISEYETIWYYL